VIGIPNELRSLRCITALHDAVTSRSRAVPWPLSGEYQRWESKGQRRGARPLDLFILPRLIHSKKKYLEMAELTDVTIRPRSINNS